ncbi:MAG TPA: ATP-binding protein [Roseiflexaceae bacterium]|nr:ATP-binding protein [Roseiflexaceae bacterium]
MTSPQGPQPGRLSMRLEQAIERGTNPLGLLPALHPAFLRWAIGGFCVIVGALMLIVPHQFSSPAHRIIRPHLPWAGSIYLFAGMVLLTVTALRSRRPWQLAGHVSAAVVLLFHAALLFGGGAGSGLPIYLVLGLGTLATALLPVAPPGRTEEAGDLLALLIGLCSGCNGLVMLAMPDQFQLSIYDLIRPLLPVFGLAFLGCGLLLFVMQLWPRRPVWLLRAAHLLQGCTFLSFMLLVSVPSNGISGMVFYGGFGILVAVLPWLRPALRGLDTRTLQLRLALLLTTAAALPLTLTVALITDQQERLVRSQALTHQHQLASAHAQDVADAIAVRLNAINALVSGRLLILTADEQAGALRRLMNGNTDLSACATVGVDGTPLASAERAPAGVDLARLPAGIQAGDQVIVQANGAAPAIILRATGENGAGELRCALALGRLVQSPAIVAPNGGRILLVMDGAGQAIAATGGTAELLRSLSELVARRISGEQIVGAGASEQLVGLAPVAGRDWTVVMVRPASGALNSVYRARELTFAVLLLAIVAAMAAGALSARRLIHPLHTLAHAADQLADGDASAPLPDTKLNEIARVSGAFDHMRQQVMRAAATREEAIHTRDVFFSVAAHELKTPLAAMMGQTQLLQRRTLREQTLNERDQQTLSVILAQTRRLSNLVAALLDVSRLQQGHLPLELAPHSLLDLVRRAVDEIQPTLDRHTLRVYEDDPLPPVRCDALRLEQALHNLISNAVKYSPAGGEVGIRLGCAGDSATIAVVDRGIGIPDDALPRLFAQFYRAPNVEYQHISGLGIGLYVVREIMTLHGGTVTVVSTEGQGSTFTLHLPLEAVLSVEL